MDVRARVFLGRRHALQHQHQRAPRRAHVDRFVTGVQYQDRSMQAFLVIISNHVVPPASAFMVISKLVSASRLSVRATASSATCAAPARFNTRAHAAAVEPVVNTSSTSNTRAPSNRTFLLTANAPPTLVLRLALVSPACGAVAFTRRTARRSGTFHFFAISCASISD